MTVSQNHTKQIQIEKKEKKSREEIFYQMKVFLFRSVVGSVFVNRPGADS